MSTQARRGRKVQKKKNNQQTLRIFYGAVGGIALIGLAFLITFLLRNDSESGSASLADTITPPNAPVGTTPDGFYYKGDPDAPVKVIEYSDYQCPACQQFVETIGRRIDAGYVETGQVQFIYHELPLRSIHPNAVIAAEAARAAGEQGKYWEMHDAIFANQTEWSTSGNAARLFANYAEQLGLDREQFEEALSSGQFTDQILAAEQSAAQAGVGSTPSFSVNGTPANASQLIMVIEAALAATSEQE